MAKQVILNMFHDQNVTLSLELMYYSCFVQTKCLNELIYNVYKGLL